MRLDLHPLVDTMSALALMLFALVGGVSALSVEQNLVPPDIDEWWDDLGPPPLTVHLAADHAWVARRVEEGVTIPRVDGALDLAAIEALVAADRDRFPSEQVVIVNTDDGVAYGDMMAVLDLAAGHGYDLPLLAGGPPVPGPD